MSGGVTGRQTLSLIKADLQRRLELEGKRATTLTMCRLAIQPGAVAVMAYRLSNWLFHHGHSILLRGVQDLAHLYTGTEMHAGSVIGPGLVLSDGGGIGVPRFVNIGKCCTVLGRSSMTLGGLSNIDLSRDRITIGDHCVIGSGVRVVGAVSIADGTQIKPNSVVLISSPIPGAILSGMPARRRSIVPLDLLTRWNPMQPALPMAEPGGSSPMADAATGPPQRQPAAATPLDRSLRQTFRLIRADIAFRCKYENKPLTRLTALRMLMHPGVGSVVRYRLQCFCFAHHLGLLGGFLKFLNLILYSVDIDERAQIGGGLNIAHAVSVTITAGVVIGERCILFHQNTLGLSPFCEPGQAPGPLVIGDDVVFGGGSCAYGDIVIGDGCQIGVNSVVERSVAPRSVVFGVPARVVARVKEPAAEAAP